MDIIDYLATVGAFIDRDYNRQIGLEERPNPFGIKTKSNFKRFKPTNIFEVNETTTNLQVLVRIETNIKINMVLNNEQFMISGEKEQLEPEVHFVLFETVTDRFENNWNGVKKMIKQKFFQPAKLSFDEWVIVDFDDCLNGNNHI